MARLTIVIPDLRCGGIQRAVTTIVPVLMQRGHQVTVVTFSDSRSDFFSLPAEAARIELGIQSRTSTPLVRLIPGMLGRLRALRRAVLASDPEVVIAHAPQVNVPTLLALRGSGLPVIATEHGDVRSSQWKKAAWYRLRRPIYRMAFRVVSVSQSVDDNVAWLPRERRTIIFNPVAVPSPLADRPPPEWPASLGMQDDLIVSMGHLSHAKGFDILIAAFARIAGQFPQWRLLILGEGELRSSLERQTSELGLSGRVVFAGAVVDPAAFLRRAKLFVMASRYEGFPLAHGEALACGLPVIATDCPSRPLAAGEHAGGGVRELMRRSVDGVLVPCEDPAALARAMADLMSDRVQREVLAQGASDVLARFAPEKIFDDWDRLIRAAARWCQPALR